MSKRKRIALITTWFPPKNGVAVNRMHAFAKYLSPDYEIEVFTEGVTTQTIEAENFLIHYLSTDSRLNKIKHKTNDSWLKHNAISVLNVAKGILGYSTLKKWVKSTLTKLIYRHNEVPFDVVISSFSPYEPHLVALDFVKETNVPWIADMRDEMSENPTISKFEKTKSRKLEIEISNTARAVTAVSLPILKDFKKLMPDITHFCEIRNGFDHSIRTESLAKNQKFTIGYVGKFYGEISPHTFFEALLNLNNKENIQIQVKMVGTSKTFKIPSLLKNMIEFIDRVDYEEAVALMASMDANLLVHPSGKRKGVYTGKLFDYISVGKPVIGVIDKNDVAAELIDEYNCGYVADFYNIEEIEGVLLKAYRDWENGNVLRATDENIQKLHRKNEVKKLAQLIEEVSGL